MNRWHTTDGALNLKKPLIDFESAIASLAASTWLTQPKQQRYVTLSEIRLLELSGTLTTEQRDELIEARHVAIQSLPTTNNH